MSNKLDLYIDEGVEDVHLTIDEGVEVVHLTIEDNPLSSVPVSAEEGNQFQLRPDGVYSPLPYIPKVVGELGESDGDAISQKRVTEEFALVATSIVGVSNSKVDKREGWSLSNDVEAARLRGVATGATSNLPNGELLDRDNHTGVQGINTVTNLQTELDGKLALPPNDGILYGLRNGKFVPILAGSAFQ